MEGRKGRLEKRQSFRMLDLLVDTWDAFCFGSRLPPRMVFGSNPLRDEPLPEKDTNNLV